MEEALHSPYHKKLWEVALGSTWTHQIPWTCSLQGKSPGYILASPGCTKSEAWYWLSITLDDIGKRQQHNLEAVDHMSRYKNLAWSALSLAYTKRRKTELQFSGCHSEERMALPGSTVALQVPTLLRNSETEYCETSTILSNIIISNILLS